MRRNVDRAAGPGECGCGSGAGGPEASGSPPPAAGAAEPGRAPADGVVHREQHGQFGHRLGAEGTLLFCITQADANKQANTIVFDSTVFSTPQTITLGGSGLQLSDTGGTQTITGPSAGVTISGGGKSGVFEVDQGVTATITGLTITDGHASDGAGLYNQAKATLQLTDCTISGNTATSVAGGIYNSGTMTLTDSAVSGNSAVAGSGGLESVNAGASLTLTGCTVSGNSGAEGGGVFVGGTVTFNMTDSTVSGNSAGGGGGMFIACKATITDSTIEGNSASSSTSGGGGILVSQSGDLKLAGCTVSGNTAHFGGGVYNGSNGTAYINYSTLTGNTAAFGGGVNSSGPIHLNNCTIAGNAASLGNSPEGGGVYIDSGSANIIGTIVAANTTTGTTGATASDIAGAVKVAGDNNLIGPGGSDGLTGVTNITLTSAQSPGLAPLGYYGGPTETMALLPGSKAIGSGASGIGISIDQRGFALPRSSPTSAPSRPRPVWW